MITSLLSLLLGAPVVLVFLWVCWTLTEDALEFLRQSGWRQARREIVYAAVYWFCAAALVLGLVL